MNALDHTSLGDMCRSQGGRGKIMNEQIKKKGTLMPLIGRI